MTNNKRNNREQAKIQVGNISNVGRDVNIAEGDISTHTSTTGLSAADVKQLFEQVYAAIEGSPNASATDKQDIKAEVEEIQATVTDAVEKNEKVDEGFIARRFRNIARMAPDILSVITATLANPLAGVGVAIEKIAEKAKQEAGAS